MDTYTYQLTEQEYYDHTRNIVVRDRKMRLYRVEFSLILPVLLAVLIIGLGVRNTWVYLGALLLAVFWLVFANWLFQRAVRNKTEQLLKEQGNIHFSTVCLKLSDQAVSVNGARQQLQQYLLADDMITLTFSNGSELLVPTRVFENDQERTKTFLRHLMKLHAARAANP